MSRVFRALEKAEKEKQERVRGERPLKVLKERAASREETILKYSKEKVGGREEKVEEPKLPSQEAAPMLVVPPNSFAADQFRKLKTQIFLRLPNPPHSILVTSAAAHEGKTMVAFNLAITISQEIHKKSILIDGDLRRPSIYTEKYQNSKGLSNYLSDGASLSEILIDSETEDIRIITAGPPSEIASELMGSKKMEELLTSLRKLEDNTYIIIDSPPIIAASEPTLLSKMVDGIILVVMAGRTPRESIRRAAKLIDPQKIIGVVFNQIDVKPSSYYSRYKYYYHYYKK